MRQCTVIDATCDMVLEENTADILCSALTDDCIERGLNMKEGGAVYDFISDLQVGIANLADSLAAVKRSSSRTQRSPRAPVGGAGTELRGTGKRAHPGAPTGRAQVRQRRRLC